MHREGEDSEICMLHSQVLDELKAAGAAEGEIHDHRVRRGVSQGAKGAGAGVGLTYDFPAVFTLQEMDDAFAEDGMIVDDEDAEWAGGRHLKAAHGGKEGLKPSIGSRGRAASG